MPTYVYQSDGDNYLDICLDLAARPDLAKEDLLVVLYCDVGGGTVLYPPKGAPYGCRPEEIVLTDAEDLWYFSKYWTSSH